MKYKGKDITECLALNRRNFIKLVVGGAVGTSLTPIGAKMIDDSAIWTQNWPWVPVPRTGEFSQEKSICTMCNGGCGIEVRKVGDRAVKIEGRTDYPVNPGGICPVGMGGLQLLYNESIRFPGPMKRTGPRDSGKFVEISWDEALKILAQRITEQRDKRETGSIAAVDGNPAGSTMALMIERLLTAIGSPNYLRIPSAEDTSRIANRLMLGKDMPVAYDLENSDFILSFGSGLLEGWGSPGRVLNAWGLWKDASAKRPAKIVQIESRASNTASKADQWLPAKPGTEGALALGLAHVIIKERLYNTEFVNNAFGFLDWRSPEGATHTGFSTMVLKNYPPETVSKITGLHKQDITELARNFSQADAPVALCGKGKGLLNGSLFESMSILALNALTGNIGRKGGVFVHDPIPLAALPDVIPDETGKEGLEKGRIDQAGGKNTPYTHSLFNRFMDTIISGKNPAVDTLLVFSSNPAFTLPEGGTFRRAMSKVPFIVSFSPFRDETSNMADLILPDHHYLEKIDDVVLPSGIQYPLYGLTRPVIKPLYRTRNSGDVIIELAGQVGGAVKAAFPWQDYEKILRVRAQGLYNSGSGLTNYNEAMPPWDHTAARTSDYASFEEMWKNIKGKGLWFRSVSANGQIKGFGTPTKRFEFYSTQISNAIQNVNLAEMDIHVRTDEACMPHYEGSHSEEKQDHHLKMVPYEMINLASGWLPQPPYLNKTLFDHQLFKGESFAEINPKTAVQYGLRQGDQAIIQSGKGRVQVRINIFEGAMPGIVYLPMGFGHTGYDDFVRGQGVNPNLIIESIRDPLSGLPVWWNTTVKITKV